MPQTRTRRTIHAPRGSLRILFSLGLCAWLAFAQGCATAPPLSTTELGFVALENGDWRTAKAHFSEALRLDSSNSPAWHGQARAQLVGHDPEGALRSLASLAKVDGARFAGEAKGTLAEALEAAAWHRLERDQPESALAAARALARLDGSRRGLTHLLGKVLVEEASRRRFRGDKETAYALYREACEVAPGELSAWVGAAEILLENKRGREAVQLLEAASKQHPTAGAIRTLTLQAIHDR